MRNLYSHEVLALVLQEREFQDKKYGSIEDEGTHTVGGWILLLESELAEAKLALIKGGVGRDAVMMEIVQVAAVAIAALEQHGLEPPKRDL